MAVPVVAIILLIKWNIQGFMLLATLFLAKILFWLHKLKPVAVKSIAILQKTT